MPANAQLMPANAQNRPILLIGIITLLATSLLFAVVLFAHPEGVMAFPQIGTRFSEGIAEKDGGTTGYDGQFVYFIARDGAEAVPYLDGPTLRYQRIIYPLVSRALAFGSADLVPWTLIIVNLLAHSIATALIAYLLRLHHAPIWGSLIYSVWIGNIFALRLDLNEPLCFALALAAVAAYYHKHYRWTILLLILSTLTKELGAIIAAGLALHAFVSRRQYGWAILIFGGPVLAFLSWWGVMRLWLGELPTQYPAAKIHTIPFEGLFTILGDSNPIEDPTLRQIQFGMALIILAIPTVIFLIHALWVIWKNRRIDLTSALMLASAGFVIIMPDVSWQDQVAVYRVGLPVVLAGILFTGTHAPKRMRFLAVLWMSAALIALIIPGLWTG